MKKKNVLISLLSSLFVLTSFSGCGGFMNSNNRLVYTLLEDGTYSVSYNADFYGIAFMEDYFRSTITNVTIPEEYNGKPVTAVGDRAFWRCGNLMSVEIPDTVTSIGESAFDRCMNLKELTLSNSLTSIGYGAFFWCEDLTKVTIPDSVVEIGASAFELCRGLTSLTIGNSVTRIGDNAFGDCEELISLVIPDSVIEIGQEAFDMMLSLKNLVIGSGVTSLGYNAIARCERLEIVYYKGTFLDWLEVEGREESELYGAQWYYYSEEKPSEGDSYKYWHYSVDGVPTPW